jgi:hypothetical protein
MVTFWLEFQRTFPESPADVPMADKLEDFANRASPVGMLKSVLLGRLMRGEEIRRKPCPNHKGVMWCAWGLPRKPGEFACCDGTGWLRNETDPAMQHRGP